MPINSMQCPKCGLTQMLSSACKSCGAPPAAPSLFARAVPSPPVHDPAADVARARRMEPPEPSPSKGEPGDQERLHLPTFHGRGATFFGIQIVNLFFTLLTFGIYYFWGKVRVRNYLLGQTEFKEERFAYHGTGSELVIGFLKAFAVVGSAFAMFNAAPPVPGGLGVRIMIVLLGYFILILFMPLAIVGSRRYRLSRTSWRGIRFSFRGGLKGFAKLFITGNILTILTFGLYRPIFHAEKYGFLTSHSYFGGRRLGFDGRGQDLLLAYVLNLFLTLPTLGLCWIWYLAKRHRYYWSHTTFGEARFESTVTGPGLLGLWIF